VTTTPNPLKPVRREDSVRDLVAAEWDRALRDWKSGAVLRPNVDYAQLFLDNRRQGVQAGNFNPEYDWASDLFEAEAAHKHNLQYVEAITSYNEALEKRWDDELARRKAYIGDISLEALRSLVLVNGAAILGALALISSSSVPSTLDVAAKILVGFCVVSLLAGVSGYLTIFLYVDSGTVNIEKFLIRPIKHKRLNSLFRYNRRYFWPGQWLGNVLVYASIGCFAVGAGISAVVLIFT
jgi:hypothetical protein